MQLSKVTQIGLLFCFLVSFVVYSQNQYTLEQILKISAQKSVRIQLIENARESDKQQVQIYRSEAFPKIDFATSIGYSNQTQRGNQVTMTSDIVAIFDRLDGYLFNWSLTLQQPLFEFGKIFNSFHLATLSKKILEQNSALQRDIFFLEVIEQYTRSYISQFDFNSAEQSLSRSKRLLQMVNLDFKHDQTSRRDLLRTQSSFEGSNAAFIRAKTDRILSIQRLNVLIGLPDTVEYSLVLDTNPAFLATPDTTHVNNREVLLKEFETKVNHRLLKNTWAGFFPSLSIFASIYNEFFAVDTTGLTQIYLAYVEANPNFPPGAPLVLFPENPSAGEFFNPAFFNYSLGVQLNWNIFDGTQSWAKYKQAKLNERRSIVELDQLKREKNNEICDILGQITSVDNAINAYNLQYEAAQKALEQADMDIKDGFINAVTYLETDQEYRDAARQVDQARLQRILLQAQLRLAMGLSVYDKE